MGGGGGTFFALVLGSTGKHTFRDRQFFFTTLNFAKIKSCPFCETEAVTVLTGRREEGGVGKNVKERGREST